jgi:3-methyladenine DNA glycosylase AlkD
MKPSGFVKELRKVYQTHADAELATGMKKYMRNLFDYYGIKKPQRAELNKPLFRVFDELEESDKEEVVRQLWKLPQRELQYFAMEAIARKPKLWDESIHLLFDEMILGKSWWDTVDFIAVNCCGAFLKLHPGKTSVKVKTWTSSPDFWMHRTALLFQLKYKVNTDEDLLFSLCRKYANEKEFFIRKGIGWVLREYSKTNPAAVKKFISGTKLSPLSIKEGSKYI